MAFNIRMPNINAGTDREQLAQIRNYLYSFAEQLQWALNSIDSSSPNVITPQPKSTVSNNDVKIDELATFNAIKSLIIKSADIVEAYHQEISKRLDGEYVATSEYGTFKSKTSNDIAANSENITSIFTNLQNIIADIDDIEHTLIDVNSYIRSGLLYTDEKGIPIYGVEVGQRNVVDGVEVFNQFARFTADKLSFYDHNGYEVAYISDFKLYITHVVITGSLTGNAFRMDFTKGFRLKYVGRG